MNISDQMASALAGVGPIIAPGDAVDEESMREACRFAIAELQAADVSPQSNVRRIDVRRIVEKFIELRNGRLFELGALRADESA